MAIIGPSQLPVLLKVDSNPIKFHILSQLGHPVVHVEITEPQMEQILRSTGDFVAKYFPLEERYSYFLTSPLQAEYPIPDDAHFIRNVSWDPATTRIDDIFGSESFLFNIGNISGIMNLLTDYHLLQSYRKFSQRILGTEGQWEFRVSTNTIRLFPVPRGAFPVVVQYIPNVDSFKSPQAREAIFRVALARGKEALGHARRKISGLPGPEGSSIQLDGEQLVTEGREEYKEALEFVLSIGEPLGPYLF